LRAAVAQPFLLHGREVVTSISIGLVVSAARYRLAEDMVRDADTAMYRAKALGKARCEIFDTSMLAAAEERLVVESDLRHALARLLRQLRGPGVRLGRDDFGMRYCALSYLQHFPFQTIKLDRTFVSGIQEGGNREIVRAIMSLAAGFAMNVTAEGIETVDQV